MKGKNERKKDVKGEPLVDGILLSDDELDEAAGGGNALRGDSSQNLHTFQCPRCGRIPGKFPRGGSAVICSNCDILCWPIN